MKKRLILLLLTLVVFIVLFAAVAMSASAAPNAGDENLLKSVWVEPSEANHIPAQIDIFVSKTEGKADNRTYTCQLYLPGNAVPGECFLYWSDDSLHAAYNNQTYVSGACPIPSVNSENTYTFTSGNKTATYKITTYQGSESVTPVFIVIDESEGHNTIAQMDGDANHNTECTGTINIAGTWYDMPKIKGRGNATWEFAQDKKPYNITIQTLGDGKKINFPGINSKKTRKWSFLAEVTDHSLLSNRSGYYLAEQLGIGQSTTSADVWMNGEYQGCYTVTPKTDSFVSDDGFMIEQDNYQEPAVTDGGDPQFTLNGLNSHVISSTWTSSYNLITVKKIGDNLLGTNAQGEVDESPERMEAVAAEIQSWLQDAWDAMRSDSGYNSKGKYYTDYIDIESFAKMYLMHEYAKSYDVCAGSILFYRDGMTDDKKLIAGPMWDLDNAMGSTCQNGYLGKADDRTNGDRRSAEGDFIQNITNYSIFEEEYKTSIYKTLSKHSDFMKEVKHQYNLHRADFESLESDVTQMISSIEASATMNHIKVKDITGTYANTHKYSSAARLGSGQYEQNYLATTNSKTDWSNYAANLKTYIRTRSLWFYNNYYDPNDPANCEHDYTAVVTKEASCTEDGVRTYTCSKCHSSYTEAIPKLDHNYVGGSCTGCGEKLINVTISCSKGASVTVYYTNKFTGDCQANADSANPRDGDTGMIDCSGEAQVNFVVDLEDHYLLAGVNATPAKSYKNLKGPEETNVENGYRITKVKGDLTITVEAVCDHEYSAVVTEPTCTEQGYTTHTCSYCEDSYVDTYVDALGHGFGQWSQSTPPTCTAEGEETRTCSRCSATETRAVAALGHDYTDVVTEPTCTEQGYTTYTCARCGDSYVDSYVDALEHDFVQWSQSTPPTCTAEGEETRTCSRCSATETRAVAALGHDYTDVETEPTCTEQGYTTYTCTRCGDSYVDNYVNAHGHDYHDGVCIICGDILPPEPINYSIKFNANGGTGTMTGLSKCVTGETYTIPANKFKRTGYTFTGWNTAADGSGTGYAPEGEIANATYTPDDVVTLYAQWQPYTYTVIFDGNGATNGEMDSIVVSYDESRPLPANLFEKAGYDFKNWSTKANGSGTKYNDGAEVKNLSSTDGGEVVLYAQWEAKKYSIVFDGNGEDVTGATKAQTGLANGKTYTLSANKFTKEGYHFAGWNTKPNGNGDSYKDKEKVIDLDVEGGEVVLYAQWEQNTYSVTYNGNGGKYIPEGSTKAATTYTQQLTYDKEEALEEVKFTREGYSFVEWNLKKNGTGDSYTDGATGEHNLTAKNKGKVTLYAIWRAHKYTIEFDANDAAGITPVEGSMESLTIDYGVSKALTANSFTRAGYTFAGWNTKEDGSGTKYANKAKIKNLTTKDGEELTLYAQWTVNTYSVKFNMNKGTAPDKTTFAQQSGLSVDNPLVIPNAEPTRKGYVFTGWNTKADGTGDHYEYKPDAEEVQLYAQKNKQTFTLYAEWVAES